MRPELPVGASRLGVSFVHLLKVLISMFPVLCLILPFKLSNDMKYSGVIFVPCAISELNVECI